MFKPADRLDTLPPFFFATLGAKIAALAEDGHDVIRLDIGSPDLPPSHAIIEALSSAASRTDTHGYQSYNGTADLRQAWAQMYQRIFSVDLDPDTEIANLLGSKEGIFHLLQAAVNPGDVVLVPDPGYPTYHRGTIFAGGEPYHMSLLYERDFTPDFSLIPPDILHRAKVMWLNYPNNPTGASVDLDFFTQAVEFAHQHEILLCHDGAYSQVTFDGYQAPSILQVPGAKEVCVEFNSLSKSHNMAGWRIGVAIGNPGAIKSLLAYKSDVDSGHFKPILEAAAAALTGDQTWLAERNQVYQQRRDILVQALHAFGYDVQSPRASMYLWFAVPPAWTSVDFTSTLLEDAHISLTPGTVFGSHGEGYVRISLASPIDRIQEAIERFADWWASV